MAQLAESLSLLISPREGDCASPVNRATWYSSGHRCRPPSGFPITTAGCTLGSAAVGLSSLPRCLPGFRVGFSGPPFRKPAVTLSPKELPLLPYLARRAYLALL